jgi:hypothetical protein
MRTALRTRGVALLGGVGLVAASLVASGTTAAAAPLDRPSDPVVITGATVPALQGAAVGTIVGFAYDGASWVQIPVQVDERALLDLGLVYHGAANNVKVMGYTSPKTWAGKDPNPKFDADDEIAFMARDAGVESTAASQPTGTVAGSGVALHLTDPLNPSAEGFVYLFRRAPRVTGMPQGAKKHYVHYSFKLLSGQYKTTYNLADGPNPENSLASGATYRHHFGDRWMSDRIELRLGTKWGADLLDRHKALFGPGVCGRSEDTFDDAEGAFVVNKVGAVRAIRSYIGANSGPNTERDHFFYDRREDVRTALRVHAIPGIMDFFDYSPAASGMTYRNELNPGGFTIDGNPETPTAGSSSWEQVTGAPGTITQVAQLSTSFTPTGLTSYYLDDSTPPVTQCTGDAFAYGSSGLWVNGSIPCTDPQLGCSDTLVGTRTMLFEGPGGTAASAAAQRDRVLNPLAVSAAAYP